MIVTSNAGRTSPPSRWPSLLAFPSATHEPRAPCARPRGSRANETPSGAAPRNVASSVTWITARCSVRSEDARLGGCSERERPQRHAVVLAPQRARSRPIPRARTRSASRGARFPSRGLPVCGGRAPGPCYQCTQICHRSTRSKVSPRHPVVHYFGRTLGYFGRTLGYGTDRVLR